MALTRSLNRLELATVQRTVSEALEREGLTALSQRKLNALGLPLAYIDRNQRYRFANSAFLTWIAKKHEEVVGHEVIEVIGREVYALYNAYIDAALDGERTNFERQLSTPGRPPIWIRVDYYPDRTPQGQVRGFLVTYADVDNVKRVELESGQREHRLRLVIDSVGSPILYFDRQLKVRFANKPFGDWIGVAADDLLGHAVREVLSGEAFAELQGLHRARVRRGDGRLRAPRPARKRRAALDPRLAVPRSRPRWPHRRRVRRDDGHRGRRSRPRRAQGPGSPAAPVRRQHPGTDRVPRPVAALHVREPGVRELGLQAAGRHLRQVASRRAQVRRVVVPAPDPEARAVRRARRVRADRQERERRQALDARPRRARSGLDR